MDISSNKQGKSHTRILKHDKERETISTQYNAMRTNNVKARIDNTQQWYRRNNQSHDKQMQ